MANLGDKKAFADMGTSKGLMAARLSLGYWGVKLTIRLCVMIQEITYISSTLSVFAEQRIPYEIAEI